MHEELFHSPERPFRATPDARFYFPHDGIEGARQTVVRAALRAEGPVMVLGGAGLGKSLLGMVVAQDLASRFDIVQLHAARLCSRRALLQNILFELQLPYRDLSEGDLRLSILTRLEPSSDHAPEGVLLIVDEAHTLPAKLLDELRLINNFTRANQPRTRLLLIGNLRLEHTFAEPQMESFNQRLAARCYLQPMNRQQTCDYINHQLSVAGLKPGQLISQEAMHTVYAACDGVPRLTNQVMDHALALGIARNQCPVSSALVEEAWSDLQQLPAPWHVGADKSPLGLAASAETQSTVEFGALQDDQAWPADDDLASEPVATATGTQSPGFFAAFGALEESIEGIECAEDSSDSSSVNDTEAMDDPLPVTSPTVERTPDMHVSPQTSNCSQKSAEQSTHELETSSDAKDPLVRPNVVFNASEAFASLKSQTPPAPPAANLAAADLAAANRDSQPAGCAKNESCDAPESFFRNRPTDERLLALEDEQHGYDAMGVWENDPPLAPRTDSQDMPIFHHSPGASQLFGDDFEVEESLPGSDDELDSLATSSARQAAEAAEYLGRIQEFADALNTAEAADDEQRPANELTGSANSTELDTWTLDVASLDSAVETAVHEEIEDMVSQLNFAAFSVEPFSVEQIPIESSEQRPRSTNDTSRSGPNDEIYTMHRPLEGLTRDESSSGQGLFANYADDDRDLLVIEEELPLATDKVEEKNPHVTKIAPYSQLFAKLRK